MEEARPGRPRVNPDYNPVCARDKMASAVAEIYLHPLPAMATDDKGHASMKELQLYFGLTMTKLRKLLVTAGVYSFVKDGVDMVKVVQDLHRQGKSLEEIKELLSISTGTANSFLPYKSGTYNADFTADEYDYTNVSTEARRKRNQRKREKLKDTNRLENRKGEIADMEEQRTAMLCDSEENLQEPLQQDFAYVMQEQMDNRKEEKLEGCERGRRGSFSSIRYVHGKSLEKYIFYPKAGDFYRNRLQDDYEQHYIIEAGEGMYGVKDEQGKAHMFMLQHCNVGSGICIMLKEIYKCLKNGKLRAGQPRTEYEFYAVGPRQKQDQLVKEVIEKAVISLQNLSVQRKKAGMLSPESNLIKNGYYYFAKDVGSIEIFDNPNGAVQFCLDGVAYSAEEAVKLFSPYSGWRMQYQIVDRTENALENDMILMPVRINEDTLVSELNDLVFLVSEKHRGDFISYKDVPVFDTIFANIVEKLGAYYKSRPREMAKKAGDKLINILKEIGTDDDMFPEYEIQMVRDAVKDLWER